MMRFINESKWLLRFRSVILVFLFSIWRNVFLNICKVNHSRREQSTTFCLDCVLSSGMFPFSILCHCFLLVSTEWSIEVSEGHYLWWAVSEGSPEAGRGISGRPLFPRGFELCLQREFGVPLSMAIHLFMWCSRSVWDRGPTRWVPVGRVAQEDRGDAETFLISFWSTTPTGTGEHGSLSFSDYQILLYILLIFIPL